MRVRPPWPASPASAGLLRRVGVTVERVLTDNGNGYRSGVFRQVVTGAGVAHKRTRPYRPQSNGKVERLNLTLDREWAYARPYTSNQQRLAALPPWLHHDNHHRPTGPSTDGAQCSYSTISPAHTPRSHLLVCSPSGQASTRSSVDRGQGSMWLLRRRSTRLASS
jgi:transposase InsO family protein